MTNERWAKNLLEYQNEAQYIKDLEDMLKMLINLYSPYDSCSDHHLEDCWIGQAKALLERTGYTEDF